jgi:hypothetical protein
MCIAYKSVITHILNVFLENVISILSHCLGLIRLKLCGIGECLRLISVIEPGFPEYSADCLEPHSDI